MRQLPNLTALIMLLLFMPCYVKLFPEGCRPNHEYQDSTEYLLSPYEEVDLMAYQRQVRSYYHATTPCSGHGNCVTLFCL